MTKTTVTFDVTRRIAAGKSSQIAKLEYSTESMVLRVEFRNGGTYDYFDVPAPVVAPAMTQEIDAKFSIGSWLNANVKPLFRFEKVSRELIPDFSLEQMSTEEYNQLIAQRREARTVKS